MKLDATILKAMKRAGIAADLILAFAEEYEALTAEKRAETREQNRIRQQNHRSRNAVSHVTERDVCDEPPSDKEKSPEPPKEITSPHSPPKGGSYTPRAALESVLDADHAQSVLEHRQRLGKPLTANAARLLAAKLSQWPNPNEAADEMVANGWQGFKPAWMEDRERPRTTGPPKPPDRSINDVFEEMKNGTWKGRPGPADEPDSSYIETSFHRGN